MLKGLVIIPNLSVSAHLPGLARAYAPSFSGSSLQTMNRNFPTSIGPPISCNLIPLVLPLRRHDGQQQATLADHCIRIFQRLTDDVVEHGFDVFVRRH